MFGLGVALPFAPASFVTIDPGLPAAWRYVLYAGVVVAHAALVTHVRCRERGDGRAGARAYIGETLVQPFALSEWEWGARVA